MWNQGSSLVRREWRCARRPPTAGAAPERHTTTADWQRTLPSHAGGTAAEGKEIDTMNQLGPSGLSTPYTKSPRAEPEELSNEAAREGSDHRVVHLRLPVELNVREVL